MAQKRQRVNLSRNNLEYVEQMMKETGKSFNFCLNQLVSEKIKEEYGKI